VNTVSVKFNFDSKKLEKQIIKQIEKNPSDILKQKAGRTIDATCPKCGSKGIKITTSGDGECLNCKTRIKIEFDIK
jgi:Zn finger protein HypA/HybF involved in hydrogenase expression